MALTPKNSRNQLASSPGGNGASPPPNLDRCSQGAGTLPVSNGSGAGDLDLPDRLSTGPSPRTPCLEGLSGVVGLDLPGKLSTGPKPSRPCLGDWSGVLGLDLPRKLSTGPKPSRPFLGDWSGAGDLLLPCKVSTGPRPRVPCWGWSGAGDLDLSRTVSVVPGGCHLAPDTADVGLLLSGDKCERRWHDYPDHMCI